MSKQRIILVNSSPLLRDIFNRVLLQAGNLEIVQEILDFQNLPTIIQNYDVEWVVMELPDIDNLPNWLDHFMDKHPSIHFMVVSTDGSHIKTKWIESREEEFTDLTLPDLINILER